MELLKGIANISGKSGLYKILKPTKTGVIVEALDDTKKKQVIGGNARVSVLNDISVYVEEHQDSSVPLAQVLMTIKEKHPEGIEMATKQATNEALFDFMETIVPNYDKEKVYSSDIKKIITWYNLLLKNSPEVFETQEESVEKI